MPVELIMRRKGHTEFDKMIVIWKFCEERFGKTNYLNTWGGDFADDTDNYVAFKFWDEQMATYLKLTYPELMTREEFDNAWLEREENDKC
jgi:hypothetical protein